MSVPAHMQSIPDIVKAFAHGSTCINRPGACILVDAFGTAVGRGYSGSKQIKCIGLNCSCLEAEERSMLFVDRKHGQKIRTAFTTLPPTLHGALLLAEFGIEIMYIMENITHDEKAVYTRIGIAYESLACV